jgi:hypothetical protein
MAFATLNFWAILAAAGASFLFGGAYYGLLSKPWMRAVGKSEEEIRQTGMAIPLLVTIVALTVMAVILGGIIHHTAPGPGQIRGGLVSGALCWLGFVATTLATNHAYQGARPALTLIDSGYWLGVLLIQGAVIGALGVTA